MAISSKNSNEASGANKDSKEINQRWIFSQTNNSITACEGSIVQNAAKL